MSRSNPTINQPNPSSRWFEWDGANGAVRYYDKEAKKNIEIEDGFTFILLDQLSTVKGWHEPSESGIYGNEVRDTKLERMVVKSFKGGELAEGFYSQIRDRVKAIGGHFVANCYIAFKDEEDEFKIGSIQFKGASLNSWVDFSKANRKAIYEQAVKISGYAEGKKGKVVFRTPKFFLKKVSEDTNNTAKALDQELQEYLKGYFARATHERPAAENEERETHPADEEMGPNRHTAADLAQPDDDNVPF